MTSASDAASSIAPPTTRTRRGLSGRLTSLFNSKQSHINDYHIELDDPHKVYGPSDTVSGKIILSVAKPLGITHLTVCLYGFVEVFKNHSKSKTNTRSNGVRVGSGKGRRWVSEYYGDGFATLFEDEQVLCGDGRLDPNLYHFRFEMVFPSTLSLPSSIDVRRRTIWNFLFTPLTCTATV